MSIRLPAPRRRQQLLEVARQVMAEKGFNNTSMNDLAEAAGVTKPVLYQHFDSKRALFSELLDEVGAGLIELVTKTAAGADTPRQQVHAGFKAYFDWVATEADAFRLLYGGDTRRDEEFSARADAIDEAVAENLALMIDLEGYDLATRSLLAHGLVGLGESTSRRWIAMGLEPDPDRLADAVTELVWFGLRNMGGESR